MVGQTLIVEEVPPGGLLHWKEYGAAPPEPLAIISVHSPKQIGFATGVAEAVTMVTGTNTEAVLVHEPFITVTV